MNQNSSVLVLGLFIGKLYRMPNVKLESAKTKHIKHATTRSLYSKELTVATNSKAVTRNFVCYTHEYTRKLKRYKLTRSWKK
jgi:Ni,Fe-hydrogenase I cytochrome b subunit